MLTSVWSVAVSVALGANPGYGPAPQGQPGGEYPAGNYPAQASQATYPGGNPAVYRASCAGCSAGSGGYASGYDSYGGGADGGYGGGMAYGGSGGMSYGGPMGGGYQGQLPSGGAYPGNEPLFPYDSQMPWMHGYFQEIPPYGGFVSFRPYNYKHVMPQAQTAGGWGMSPTMPYSQQFWHRFQQSASMSQPLSYQAPAGNPMSARFARNTMNPAAIRAPMTTQENVPASYVKTSEPAPRATQPATQSGPSFGIDPSQFQRFNRE